MSWLLSAILRSRVACSLLAVAAVLGGFFLWHKLDKSSAVRRAVAGYVADVELAAARTEVVWLKHQRAVADRASRRYQEDFERALADAAAAAEELEHYVSTVDDACVVEPDLFDRLRNR